MSAVRVLRVHALPEGDELPTEFLIFSPGEIETTEGVDVFDAEAARSVMAIYQTRGVDPIVDLEHYSVLGKGLRADEKDARGHYKLELRADGSLWAVDVKWTPDGARRLREKTQRYISPLFMRDKETHRITELLNVALVSMPATHDAAPLVAASRSALAWRNGAPSNSDVMRAVDAALLDRYPRDPTSTGAYVCDVYPDRVIVDYEGAFWSTPYTYANGAATLGAPTQVVRQYVPVGARSRRVAIARAERQLALMQKSCHRKRVAK